MKKKIAIWLVILSYINYEWIKLKKIKRLEKLQELDYKMIINNRNQLFDIDDDLSAEIKSLKNKIKWITLKFKNKIKWAKK